MRMFFVRLFALLTFVCLSQVAFSQDETEGAPLPKRPPQGIQIAADHRVANTDPSGVCWFCCAAMIGKHANIVPLQDLDQRVLKSGIGHKTGATAESVQHWMKELGVKPLVNDLGKKDAEGVKTIQGWLDKGLPVIASYEHNKGSHAILLTYISRTKAKWTTTDNEEVEDYYIRYVDPDDHTKTWRASWTWFHKAWTGRAYAFDPKEQDPRVIAAPELRPGRLMVATGKYMPTKKVLPPELVAKMIPGTTAHTSPPIEARYEAPPYMPHQLPFRADYPAYNEKIKVPSNQDIKDGVTRPRDFFVNNCYGYFDYNYHAEYEAFKAKKKP